MNCLSLGSSFYSTNFVYVSPIFNQFNEKGNETKILTRVPEQKVEHYKKFIPIGETLVSQKVSLQIK